MDWVRANKLAEWCPAHPGRSAFTLKEQVCTLGCSWIYYFSDVSIRSPCHELSTLDLLEAGCPDRLCDCRSEPETKREIKGGVRVSKSYYVFTSQALTTLERLDCELAMLGCLLLKELTESRDREMGQRKRCGSLFKPAVCHFYYGGPGVG